jgi:hypothetical protein
VIALPLPYYVTHIMERYRYPLEPLLVVGVAASLLVLVDRFGRARGARVSSSP